MIKIALIDDHIVVRSGFAQLLSLEEDIQIVGEFNSAAQAWPYLLKGGCDIAILDISMPDESGLSLLRRIRQVNADFKAIFLSIYDTNAFVKNAVDAGASGYLTKRCGPEELVRAIRTVYGGGFYLCADALKALRQTAVVPKELQMLTPREKEIFDLLINGLSAREIAEKLNLSHKTIHVHRANILAKLHCDSIVELVHFALEHQLLTEK
ncbi:response regulator transcription factor [Pragia fontium]|uniref:Two-component system, NarL family, uhpT operon response regulator UhpA n=2 Tax=Pragia fontium TaxID=82985 RepID=A0AAJ4W919_9GAMM|nr:response regulator transcription factor [Pragia fontium]AKJ41901.1 transcriptional regulator [Pragia fontium]SFC40000.1 two-component system, NarL family, uhpT operon response regulator UhpA [Pragia fontium DSM 5563 = ATCC 49100]SUB82126.1 Transcriptional regulatory protein uhpA [Pragia fontium]VEJ54789.1 Transcriptional regulatory protein uhpA [Pragia fontium]GKX62075.1 DNA-binding response regulator [Pragia fontium]